MVALGCNDTVTIVHYTQTGQDMGGAAVLTATTTVVPGCRHRALVPVAARGGGEARAEKGAEIGVGIATAWWQTTFPINPNRPDLTAAILAIVPTDALQAFGQTFQIIGGLHIFTDDFGKIFKVTTLSERQTTG
jgi:hypothetical protein